MKHEQGMALIVALILLLAMTLVSVGAIRGVTMQERMTANVLDRSLAFQAAETALRAGILAVYALNLQNLNPTNLPSGWRNCAPPNPCLNNPFTEPATATGWQNVPVSQRVNSALLAGIPQFQIRWLGEDDSGSQATNAASANYAQYGAAPMGKKVQTIEILARSGAPNNARSIVVLQGRIRVEN